MCKTLERMTRAYLEAALWTETDDDDNPLDGTYTLGDFAPGVREAAEAAVKQFLGDPRTLTVTGHPEFDFPAESLGHDLWLTRNGHGAGFWDREELKPHGWGDTLTKVASDMGEKYIYVGDDGKLYIG